MYRLVAKRCAVCKTTSLLTRVCLEAHIALNAVQCKHKRHNPFVTPMGLVSTRLQVRTRSVGAGLVIESALLWGGLLAKRVRVGAMWTFLAIKQNCRRPGSRIRLAGRVGAIEWPVLDAIYYRNLSTTVNNLYF